MSIPQPTVAVVILNWNGAALLQQFLPSVIQHSTLPNVRIVLADNASTDNSIALVKEFYPSVEVIQNDANYGFAEGYNKALQQIDTDYYILLNSDVEVTPNWIDPVIEVMEKDKTIAACQPKLRAYHEKTHFEYAGAAGGLLDQWGFSFCRGRLFDHLEPDTGQYDTNTSIFWASGAALFIRAPQYHQFGGLDPYFFAHFEEIDLCWRLKNAGYDIHYCSNSMVYHVGGATLNKTNPKKTYLNFRNNLIMMIRNATKPGWFFWVYWRMVIDGAAALKFLLSGETGNFKAVVKAHFHIHSHWLTWLKMRKAIKKIKQTSSIGPANRKGIYSGSILYQYFIKKVRVIRL